MIFLKIEVSILNSDALNIPNNKFTVIPKWISYRIMGTYFLFTNCYPVGNILTTLKPPP